MHAVFQAFNKKKLEDRFYIIGWLILPVILLGGWVLRLLEFSDMLIPTCMVYRVLGFYCPGCGGTRAVLALFHGNLLQCLWYHPLVFYGAAVYMCFMLTHTLGRLHIPYIKPMKYRDGYLYLALVIIAVNFVLKNILHIFFDIHM